MKYLQLLRVSHWIKNLFFFLPVFFAGDFFKLIPIELFLGFFYFSLTASSIYVINDFRDRKKDALHPVKKFRPLASNSISPILALSLAAFLLIIGIGGSLLLNKVFFIYLISYFILNLAYSLGVKNIPIVDVLCIAIGFVIRIHAGAILADVPLSNWLVLMVFLLALFMALGKRRDDVILQLESGLEVRKAIDGYNKEFLNVGITIVSSVILVCYLMYCMSPEVVARLKTTHLFYTSIFVLMGILRYLQIIFVKNDSGSPTKILYKDLFLQITLLLWILSFYFLIYRKDFMF
ncbi:MAG: hypothetical protein RJA76_1734 [Bacteroidota bacterium]|jgi:4-hydroxybenzoate polyprenyltransferase